MASIRDLKKRITSVKNTRQTTKAMKMVSAAKLRRAQNSIVNNRPYAKGIDHLIRLVSELSDHGIESPLLVDPTKAGSADDGQKKDVLLLMVTSDRGLCGGFNGNISRRSWNWVHENKDKYNNIHLGFYGKKALEFFKARDKKEYFFNEFGKNVSFNQAKDLANWIIDEFEKGSFQEVKIVYNEFKNAITQEIVVEDFLPVCRTEVIQEGDRSVEEVNADLYLVRPEPSELMGLLLRKHFAIQINRILLESQASEHGARMAAMESATKNASEMVEKLTLQFNKQRQAGITAELLEIISGAEAQDNS